jgi:hypothetical protein
MKLLQKAVKLTATIISLCLIGWISGCGKKGCREDEGTLPSAVDFELVRLEDSIQALKDTHSTRLFLERHPLFSEKFLQWSKLPHDSILIQDIYRLKTDPHIDTLLADVKKEYPDLAWFKRDLKDLFDHIRFYYPDFHAPKVYTMVSGFGSDLEVKDSVLVIGLDYFLSDSSRYRPPQIPNYILRRLKKRFLVSEIGMVIGDRYCQIDILDNSMMGEMIKWGKVFYFMEKTMPCLPDTLLTGFTETQLKGVEGNIPGIWAHYLDNNLFFSTDLFLIKKYCDERPNVVEIGNQCPGRVGRWLGWKIVRKWAQDKKVPLQKVMEEKSARKIFEQSGFKP